MTDTVGTDEIQYDEIMPRVAQLADELLAHPNPKLRDRVQELLDWVDAFHHQGLGRMIEMCRGWRGEIFLKSITSDPIVGTLLDAYDLGEADDRDRAAAEESVNAALEELRPFVESHGGTIVLDSIVDGVVKVQMLGSCQGCPSSTATLTGGVEEALRRHWPNFRRLEVVDPDAGDGGDGGSHVGHTHAAPEPQPVLLQIRGHEGK